MSDPEGVMCDLESCKGCGKALGDLRTLIGHVSRAKKCKEVYGDEFEKLKKKQLAVRKSESYRRNKDKICSKQVLYNKKNPEGRLARKRKYNEGHAVEITAKQKKYNKAHNEEIARKQKTYREEHAEQIATKKKTYNKKHAKEIAGKQREYNRKHSKANTERQSTYNKKYKKEIAEKQARYRQKNRGDINLKLKEKRLFIKKPLTDFIGAVSTGPIFPCICCHRTMFSSGVTGFDTLQALEDKVDKNLLESSVRYTEIFFIQKKLFLCLNCLLLLKKGQRPAISVCNGLDLDTVPEELKITDLEQQLIAKVLLFMKIHKLPRSRMPAITDKVINVPLENQDICQTIQSLPRPLEEASLLTVKLKRMKKLKNSYREAYIRPNAPEMALKKLKELGNPYYQFEESKKKPVEDNSGSSAESGSESDSSDDPNDDYINKDKEQTSHYNAVTCLVHEHPESEVVINKTKKPIQKGIRLSQQVFEIAPGEGKVPTNWLREHDFDVKAFPKHFPSGKYGCDYQREQKLSIQKYFNQRVLNIDGRFRSDISYIFAAQQRLEREQIEKQFDVVVQRGQLRKGQEGSSVLTSKDSFAAFQKVRGTPKYFQTARNEILAKVAQLGPFQLFFTLSCGEVRWNEVLATILHSQGYHVEKEETNDEPTSEISFMIDGVPMEDFLKESQLNKHELLRDNIFLVTRMFDNRVKQFIKHIAMSRKSSIEVEYYNYRVEFQMRGMAHIHGVMWLSKGSLQNYVLPTSEYDPDTTPELIDKLITCGDGGDSKLGQIVKDVQTHKHTKSCQKYNGQCRFGFPRLPSNQTIIATPLPDSLSDEEKKKQRKHLQQTLQKVRTVLEKPTLKDDMTIEALLEEAKVSREDYETALKTSERGTTVVLKRAVKERFINNYNGDYLMAWNANMDVQFCYDPYAVITYICDYYGKDETGMTEFLKEALTKVKDKSQEDKLRMLKLVYLTHRQIGACEAVYRMLPNLHLKDSNVACIFLGTGFPENRSIFMKRLSEERDQEVPGEEPGLPGQGYKIEGRQGSYQQTISMHERYANRPEALTDMCLGQFASMYKVSYRERKRLEFKENSSVEIGESCIFGTKKGLPLQIIFDSKDLGSMQLRTYPAVLRIHESSKKVDDHEFYYAEMLLFLPWRNEETDLYRHNPTLCKRKYKKNFEDIYYRRRMQFPFHDTIELARTKLQEITLENVRPGHIYDTLDPEGEHANVQDSEEVVDTGPDKNFAMLHPGELECLEESRDVPRYKEINVDDDEELLSLARQLIPEQQYVLDAVISYCKKVAQSWRGAGDLPEPLRIIVHGGAGTGKSNVVRAISKWAEKILRKAGDHPQKPRILLTAPTGMAASIIGGVTLHSALSFNFGDDLKPLSDKKLDEMRCSLADLKMIVVDEMSMVRSDMLYQLHSRLCEIFQSGDLFGGICVILVGDLLQLKPVKGAYIFQAPRLPKFRIFHSVTPLWDEFVVNILQHNHRQGEANNWAQTLNRLRIGDSKEDLELLNGLILTEEESQRKTTACHIFYTNEEVENHNSAMLNTLQGNLVTSNAVVTTPHGCTSTTDKHGRVDKTSFLKKLQLKVGARVMLIHNINVVDNLSNGAMGKIVDFKFKGEVLECILVKFDNESAGLHQRQKHAWVCQKNSTVTPIYRCEFQYQVPYGRSGAMQHSATSKVLQFPIRLAWAVTAHKVQGQTFTKESKIVVHWHKRFTEGMAYVMLGRCERSEDVFITGDFNANAIKCNEAAKQMTLSLDHRFKQVKAKWSSDTGLKIVLLNVRSLRKHQQDIANNYVIRAADIVCLTETWLLSDEDVSIGSTFTSSEFASTGPGRGCAIFSKAKVVCEKILTEKMQIIKINAYGLHFVLVYRSPSYPISHLVTVLEKEITSSHSTVLLGDFNIDAKTDKTLSPAMKQKNMTQIIFDPTHDQGNILDHVYVSNSMYEKTRWFHYAVYFSDHDCIAIQIDLQ